MAALSTDLPADWLTDPLSRVLGRLLIRLLSSLADLLSQQLKRAKPSRPLPELRLQPLFAFSALFCNPSLGHLS